MKESTPDSRDDSLAIGMFSTAITTMVMYIYPRRILTKEDGPATENSMVEIEQFKLILKSALVFGEYFTRKRFKMTKFHTNITNIRKNFFFLFHA